MIKILIVEDDHLLLRSIADLFRDQGADVTTADSVPVAKNYLAREKFDVILSDYNLGIGGRGVKLNEVKGDAQLIIMSDGIHQVPEGVQFVYKLDSLSDFVDSVINMIWIGMNRES